MVNRHTWPPAAHRGVGRGHTSREVDTQRFNYQKMQVSAWLEELEGYTLEEAQDMLPTLNYAELSREAALPPASITPETTARKIISMIDLKKNTEF